MLKLKIKICKNLHNMIQLINVYRKFKVNIKTEVEVLGKHFDSSYNKEYFEKKTKELHSEFIEDLLRSNSPITEFKKVSDENKISCSLKDGTSYTIPVNNTLQLFFDKMEMHPETEVELGGRIKDKILILPFQNRIVYIDGKTGKEKKSLSIDSNLVYFETDSITGQPFNRRLNPVILSILRENKVAQNDYINATGNIDIIYDFEEKSEKKKQNRANKKIAKIMNEYYKSEKEYVGELKLQNELSKKVGYVNMLDKVQSSLTKEKEHIDNSTSEYVSSIQQKREEMLKKYHKTVETLNFSVDSKKQVPINTKKIVITGRDR